MKATGIVRKSDGLGRIVVPIELRRSLDIESHDSMEIFTENDTIILKKYNPDCVFCGETNEIINFKGKNICTDCLNDLKAN